MEQTYIGTKIIAAEPMDMATFSLTDQGRPLGPVGVGSDGKGAPGYKVRYENGYISWSPKEVFERSYRPITEKEKAMIG